MTVAEIQTHVIGMVRATFAFVVFNRTHTTDRLPRIVLRLSEAAKYAL